jgi:hypothetical protein
MNTMSLDLNGKTYIIHKFSPIEGRRIVTSYPLTALPSIADYEKNEEAMLQLMKFVDVVVDGNPLRLETAALVNNHIPEWKDLVKIELETLKFNCPFITDDNIRNFGQIIIGMVMNGLHEHINSYLNKVFSAEDDTEDKNGV